MDNSRNFIIDRLKSKKVTIDEFNFDKLSAPPLNMFFYPQDIWELNSIAKSIRLSGKLQEKLRLIDNICKRRGLIKFGSGTNRVIYRHPEFNQFVFKIAYDNVALMDNFNEFRNQFVLKPFVAKTFEVSPCGTVAICERVKPITSREEFISIADDVFVLLNDFIIGKYIMADIGSQFYMNYGLREGFGPVLLDYSFLYELDENKIYCNKPDIYSPTGLCEGEIGYDDGLNKLCCSKCGAKYKAIELKKKIKDNELIVQRKGELKMKIRISGGSTNTNKVIESNRTNNDNFKNTASSILRKPKDRNIQSSRKVTINLNNEDDYASSAVKIKPNTNEVKVEKVEVPVADNFDNFAVNGVSTTNIPTPTKIDIDKFIDSLPDDTEASNNDTTEEDALHKNVEILKEIVEKEQLESPFTIDESLISNATHEIPAKSPVEIIDESVQTIIENLNNIKIDSVRDDAINRMIDKIIKSIPANGSAFKDVIEIAVSIFDNSDDDAYIDIVHSPKFVKFIQRIFDPVIVNSNIEREGNDLVVSQHVDVSYGYDITDVAYSTNDITTRFEEVFTESEAVENKEDAKDEYNGIEFASGMIINSKQLFPSADDEEIIVGIDASGDYITTREGNIIAINTINDCEVSSIDLVSKEWIKSVNCMIDDISDNEIDENTIGVTQVTEE